jgi:hypothetical protein
MERQPIDWRSKFLALHPRRALAEWGSSSIGTKVSLSVLTMMLAITLIYQHIIGGYDILPMIAVVLTYAGLGVFFWLLALLALLCGMALDRMGALVWLQHAGASVVNGVGLLFFIALLCWAVASISTPVSVIIAAVIIASAMSSGRK